MGYIAVVTVIICILHGVTSVEILAKSKLEKCVKSSDSDNLNCNRKIVLDIAVPSGSSGGEASIVAEIVEVEENSTNAMQTLRVPPVITVNKSAAYASYELTYIRDVAYKPQEYYVKTRKCEPDAGANVVKICERLQDKNDRFIRHTEPKCCPCGPQRRVPSSCGNFFNKLMKGKANTAHCVRFPGDWFHVFGIGQRSIGFNVRVEVKTGSKVSEVIVGPDNRTAISGDNFLRVNLIGDFAGYSNIPSFEDFFLVIPRQGEPDQPLVSGRNFSMWMLLERVRFTLDGIDCNKIGVGYEAFNEQPNFCSSPFWSCLHNQLWNFHDADQNRISRKQLPLYVVEGRFERVNQHPNAGSRSFSIGVTEVLSTNLFVELSADDIEYVYQRSPGKILSVAIPTFEALTQFGVASVTTKNTGEVEASYSLTFECSKSVALMEEQFFIMKPNEVATRSFKLYSSTDQAAKYLCAAILKDSNYNEVDTAMCQFSTTATVLDNGTQIVAFRTEKRKGVYGFFESVTSFWKKIWEAFMNFITGKTCKRKCWSFFDFRCHIQYLCVSWMALFGLFLAIFPAVTVLCWLLHQKGALEPFCNWWEDCFQYDDKQCYGVGTDCGHHRHFQANRRHHGNGGKKHRHVTRHHQQHNHAHHRRGTPRDHRHRHMGKDSDYYHIRHHVPKAVTRDKRARKPANLHQMYMARMRNENTCLSGQHKWATT